MTVRMVRMEDASDPANLPTDILIVAGYLGGDTPHVWTAEQWARFGHIKKLPIWVAGENTPGNDDAWAAMRRLHELRVPHGSPVVYDIETAAIPERVTQFNDIMTWNGFRTWVYGSVDNLFKNPECEGYWVADPTGVPHMYPHSGVRATQYDDTPGADLSEVAGWQYNHRLKTW